MSLKRETIAIVNKSGKRALIAKANYDPKTHKLFADGHMAVKSETPAADAAKGHKK